MQSDEVPGFRKLSYPTYIGSIGHGSYISLIYHGEATVHVGKYTIHLYPMGHTCFGKFTVLTSFPFLCLNGTCFVSEQNLTNSRTLWGCKSLTAIQK